MDEEWLDADDDPFVSVGAYLAALQAISGLPKRLES